MKIDLQLPDSWAQLNDFYKQKSFLANEPKVSLQVYLGTYHALWEIGQALAQTYPHRRTLLCDQNAGPEFEPLLVAFAKEGFSTRTLTSTDLKDPSRWLEATQKEALFLLGAFDDPATGELFDYSAVNAALKDKRIFRIRVSHSYHHFFQMPKPESYEIHVCSLHSHRALAVLGERAQIRPALAPFLNWPKGDAKEMEHLNQFNLQELNSLSARQQAIERFESLFAQAQRWPIAVGERLWDRALLVFPDAEGLSLIEQIDKDLGSKSQLRTLSLCEWQEAPQMQWLVNRGLAFESLRGSLLIDVKLIIEKGPEPLARLIQDAHQRLLLRQNGSQ